VLVADATLNLLGDALRESPYVRKPELGLDRDEDVQSRRTRRLRIESETQAVQHLAHDTGDHAHVLPLAVRGRVEVDQHVIGSLDVVYTGVPGVQLDTAEVDYPCQ